MDNSQSLSLPLLECSNTDQQRQYYPGPHSAEEPYQPPSQSTSSGALGSQSNIKADSLASITPASGKVFRCVIDPSCGAEFPRAEHLARHERKHTKEKPFKCHCEKSFTRLDNWRQHFRIVHQGMDKENAETQIRLQKVHEEIKPRRKANKKVRKAVKQLDSTSTSNLLPLFSPSNPSAPAAHNLLESCPRDESATSAFLPFSDAVPENPSMASTTLACLSTPTLSHPTSRFSVDQVYASSSSGPYLTTENSPPMTSSPLVSYSSSPEFSLGAAGAYLASLEDNRELFDSRLPHEVPLGRETFTSNNLSEPFADGSYNHGSSAHPVENFEPTDPSAFLSPYNSVTGPSVQLPQLGNLHLDGPVSYLMSPPALAALPPSFSALPPSFSALPPSFSVSPPAFAVSPDSLTLSPNFSSYLSPTRPCQNVERLYDLLNLSPQESSRFNTWMGL